MNRQNSNVKAKMKLLLISSFAIISTIMIVAPSLAFAQDPFTFGNSGDPFAVGGGGAGGDNAASGNNVTLQIRSDTDWSGSYGDSTGSNTVDGHGNKDISFACSNTYSAFFQKKGEESGFLRLNIVQPFNNTVTKIQDITKHGVPLLVGRSVILTKQITDLRDGLDFLIFSESNSSSNALNMTQPFNSTFRLTITDPTGFIILNNDMPPLWVLKSGAFSDSYTFSSTPIITPHIAGEYRFTVKNLGNSTADLGITYGSSPSQTTITTHNVTNTRTTTAQFGTVSVSGSC